MDVSRVVLFCLVALVGSTFGYEFDGGDEAVDCDTFMKNDRLVNGVVECLLSDDPECGSVLFTQVKICICALVGMTLAYEDMYEDFDYEAMMDNERLLTGLVNCLLQDGECENPMFQEIKKYAPEILETTCGLCTDKQKEKFKSCTNKFIKIRPNDYEAIMKKMDPDNKYRGPLEAFLAS